MSLLQQLAPPILKTIYQKLNIKKGKYAIGNYTIITPPNYKLPLHQQKFKLYDRFLPVLAKHLPTSKIIVDVGANIGDTMVAMIQQCSNPIYCFEPSSTFFPYLEKNISILSNEDQARVKTFKALVGSGIVNGELKHYGPGTAKIEITENTNAEKPLSLDHTITDRSNVALIKVDTDGFDFDVLQSANNICTASEPLLFWENEISEDFQYKGYNDLYDMLTNKGYKYIYIFDNFGNLISEEIGFAALRNINDYIYSMKKYNCTRTIYYTDILAATENHNSIAQKAIQEYKDKWIKIN